MAKAPQAKKRITFTLGAPETATVFLAGDFNDWDENGCAMKYSKNQRFEKTVLLSPGRYEYKFKVNGMWLCDPDNPDQCENPHGTMNSVLTIAKSK